MTSLISQYITSLLESLQASSNFGSQDSLITLLSADIVMFAGIFYLLITLSFNYKSTSLENLLANQAKGLKALLYIALVGVLLSLNVVLSVDNFAGNLMNSYYRVDTFTQLVKFVVIISSLVIVKFISFIPKADIRQGVMVELPLLFQTLLSLSFIVISSSNFALLLLTLEAFSLVLYILTTLERAHGGVTAAVKYFSFGTLGSIFLFWGAVHFYSLIPSLSYKAVFFITEQFAASSNYISSTLEFAFGLFAVGFLIKLGAAPLHQWVADVYTGSHTLVTTIFATLVKFILFAIFVRTVYYSHNSAIIDLFIVSSLIVGCYATLKQSEIKRFVAYSSIVHVGFLLMGDISASFIYIITYVLSNLVFFSVILSVRLAGKELLYLNDLRYLRQTGFRNVILVVAALASAAGLPPFAGFYGKFLTWVSLFEDVYLFNDTSSYIILLVSIVLSLLTIFYYARAIAYLFIGDDSQTKLMYVGNNLQDIYTNTTNLYSLQFVGLFLLCLWTLVQSKVLVYVNLAAFNVATAWLI